MATNAGTEAGLVAERWGELVLLAGVMALALGMILFIIGVNAAGLLLPGVYVLMLALLLLAAGGVLRVLRP